jgi:2-iminobutanoate/2-iminopropanoate deaminase
MDPVYLNIKEAPQPIGPYSQAVFANGFLFISGQIALDPQTNNICGSNIEEQTRRALKNIKAILSSRSLTVKNLVKTTVFLKNINDFSSFNKVYEEEMGEAKPARAVVEISNLPKNALVEIEAIACI